MASTPDEDLSRPEADAGGVAGSGRPSDPGDGTVIPALDPATIPIARWYGPHAVPDLSQIDRAQWADVLRLTHDSVREHAAHTLPSLSAMGDAMGILIGIWHEEGERKSRLQAAAMRPLAFGGPPLPGSGPAPRPSGRRQVNFRVSARTHADLLEAARLVGLRPAELARFFTTRGAGQILAEAQRAAAGGDG